MTDSQAFEVTDIISKSYLTLVSIKNAEPTKLNQ
jgi:hypothetical protein